MDWDMFPKTKELFDAIIEHRNQCWFWKQNNYCGACYRGYLTPIEKELGESKYREE